MQRGLKKNILIRTFCELKGNPKWSICAEPLWFIPYSLFLPYQSLYMNRLGLDSVQIGMTLTVGFLLQIVFALIGGVINDKLGRRRTTFIFDTISWTIPCVLWALSQNFWWFLAASMVNASFQITNISWTCLFIEDCPEKDVTNAFTLIQVCGTLSVFFAPLSIYFIGRYDVVSYMRVIYAIAAVSMTLKFFLLFHFGSETRIGRERMRETKDVPFFSMLKGYGGLLKRMLKSGQMRFAALLMVLCNIVVIATGSYFSLYITQQLKIPDELVAVFPILRTIVTLLFVFLFQSLFERLKIRLSLIVGFILYAVSHVLLLLAPEGQAALIALYTLTEAAAYAVITPRRDALMTFFVDAQERSRIYSLYHIIMIGLSSPFGVIVGALYKLNPALPFCFNILLFLAAIPLVARSKHLRALCGDQAGA